MVSRRIRFAPGYDVYSEIGREVWISAALILAESEAPAARRRAMRCAHREARRGDYFAARSWLYTAKAIEWLSSAKQPRHIRLH